MSPWRGLSALLDETAFLPAIPQIAPRSVCHVASLRAGSTLNAIAVGRSSHPSLDRRRQRPAGVFLFASCSLSFEEQFIGLKLSNASSLISQPSSCLFRLPLTFLGYYFLPESGAI